MKWKTALIIVCATALTGALAWAGLKYYSEKSAKIISVVPVESVNESFWADSYDSSTIYGSVISRDSQTVELNSDYALTEVFVTEGDSVRPGDPLLAYDTTLPELKLEMEQLKERMLELTLQRQEKDLATLNGGGLPEGYVQASSGDSRTQSAELEEPAGGEDAAPAQGDTLIVPEGSSSAGYSGELLDNDPFTDDGTSDPFSGSDADPDGSSDDGMFDDGMFDDGDEAEFSDQPSGADGNVTLETALSSFTAAAGLLLHQDLSEMTQENIDLALNIFRNSLCSDETNSLVEYSGSNELFGEKRTVTVYSFSEEVTSSEVISEETRDNLYQAYIWICLYDFLYQARRLEAALPEGVSLSELTASDVNAVREQLNSAVAAYYRFTANSVDREWSNPATASLAEQLYAAYVSPYFTGSTPVIQALADVINNENSSKPLISDREQETEAVSEYGDGTGDIDGLDPGDLDTGMTAEERAEAIWSAEMEIRETKLQMRESQLEQAKLQRDLDSLTVTAQISGTVTSAGTVDGGGVANEFIVITGGEGLYAYGTISEMALDSVMIGDTVTGTMMEDYSTTFTAKITEISTYPVSNDNYWFYSGSENSNVSYYPFYAFIEESDDISEGDAELSIVKGTPGGDIFLPSYLVRTDANNKYYVYIRGNDGLLKRQYVKTGKSYGGYTIEILSGISGEDMIAFPYGKGVEPGARTQEADSLYGESYYNYG